MKLAALVLLVVAASCIADTSDGPVADVGEPGVRHGGDGASAPPSDVITASHRWLDEHHGDPCAESCFDVFVHVCAEADVCADGDPGDVVTCNDQYLSCDAAEHADRGELSGLAYCWRACSGLK